jgi:two-component system C4-dicarboxylate transport sensor histidine kinase DctB
MAMSVIVIMRKVLSELIVAGLADVTVVFLRYDRTTGRLRRNTHLSLQFSIDALVSVAVASAATLFLIGQVNGVSENIATVNDRVSRAIETWPQRDTAQRGRVYSLALSDDTRPARILVAEPGRWKAAGTAFGCKSFETEPVTVANDRNTFSYWLGLCLVEALPRGNVAIVPIRPIIQMLFVRIGQGVLPLALFLLAAQLTLILFRRA